MRNLLSLALGVTTSLAFLYSVAESRNRFLYLPKVLEGPSYLSFTMSFVVPKGEAKVLDSLGYSFTVSKGKPEVLESLGYLPIIVN